MAKPNNRNNNKKKQRPGYFQTNVQQYGENFLEMKTAKDINRDAQKVFRDIAYQNPESMKDITIFFMNRQFVSNLSIAATETGAKRYATYVGLNTFYQTNGQTGAANMGINIERYLAEAKTEYDAYYVIMGYLNNIVTVLNSGYDDERAGYSIMDILKSMSAALSQYRFNI